MFLNALKSILQNEERFPTPKERDIRLNAVSPGLAARYNKLSDMFPDVPPEELVAQALCGMAEILDIKLPAFE
jgi:hypothetical protein